MKKILGAMLLSALVFTGCMKEGNDTYKEYLPVVPGVNIYEFARTQNVLSMQPANVGVRLAILLAEAAVQEKTDLTEVVDDKGNSVMKALFSKSVKIEGNSDDGTLEAGDYRITFKSGEQMYDGFFLKGSLVVKTGGKPLSETSPTEAWSVKPEEDFSVILVVGSYDPREQTVHFTGGTTEIYANGDGSYSTFLGGISINVDEVDRYSDWGGECRFRADATSLAYSECKGKDFTVTMDMVGSTIYSLMLPESTTGTVMTYKLSEGKYLFNGKAFTGTVTCTLPNSSDYHAPSFPSDEVKIVWSFNGQSFSRVIYYNGFVYPKQ